MLLKGRIWRIYGLNFGLGAGAVGHSAPEATVPTAGEVASGSRVRW